MDIGKISIVADSGLMKGVFPWAVERALKFQGLQKVDVVCGASASAGTFAYTTSGVDGGGVWMKELINNREFLKANPIAQLVLRSIGSHLHIAPESWFNGENPVLNIDYLVNEIFSKKIRIDPVALYESPIQFIIPVTSNESQKPEFFSNKDSVGVIQIQSHKDIFKVLEATCCVPRMYKTGVNLYGKEYCDGAFSAPLPVDHPSIADSDTIIVILTHSLQVASTGIGDIEKKLYKLLNPYLGDALEKGLEARIEAMEKIRELEKNRQAIVITPDFDLKQFSTDPIDVQKTAKAGLRAVETHPQLKKFLEDLFKTEKADFYKTPYGTEQNWIPFINQ